MSYAACIVNSRIVHICLVVELTGNSMQAKTQRDLVKIFYKN